MTIIIASVALFLAVAIVLWLAYDWRASRDSGENYVRELRRAGHDTIEGRADWVQCSETETGHAAGPCPYQVPVFKRVRR